jgi:hypothetical protein
VWEKYYFGYFDKQFFREIICSLARKDIGTMPYFAVIFSEKIEDA